MHSRMPCLVVAMLSLVLSRMRAAIVIVFALLWSTPPLAQGTDGKLRSELEALHAEWFKGFDSGDGAAMDQLERDDLMLVLPEGSLFRKTTARASKQPT